MKKYEGVHPRVCRKQGARNCSHPIDKIPDWPPPYVKPVPETAAHVVSVHTAVGDKVDRSVQPRVQIIKQHHAHEAVLRPISQPTCWSQTQQGLWPNRGATELKANTLPTKARQRLKNSRLILNSTAWPTGAVGASGEVGQGHEGLLVHTGPWYLVVSSD